MSDQQLDVRVGEVMPDCEIPLRADGTVDAPTIVARQPGYFLDPVHMTLVLGVDVSPWHEQAIMRACRDDDDDLVTQTDATRTRLWAWACTDWMRSPVLDVRLFLRPSGIQLPELQWVISYPTSDLCDGCAEHISDECAGVLERMRPLPTKGLACCIIVVGRDHRVLGVTVCAMHHELALHWLVNLGMACGAAHSQHQHRPEVLEWLDAGKSGKRINICHIVGQDRVMFPSQARDWIQDHGWRETPQQLRLRKRRQKASRRAQS